MTINDNDDITYIKSVKVAVLVKIALLRVYMWKSFHKHCSFDVAIFSMVAASIACRWLQVNLTCCRN